MKSILLSLLLTYCASVAAGAKSTDGEKAFPADLLPGLWQQVDDATGRTQALVRMVRAADGTYRGIVEKIFPAPGDDPNPRCEDCRDHRRNQPVLGMQIIEGLRRTGDDVYEDGNILDPDNGKTYRLKILVKERGERLEVRGYVGISLFGRSQAWLAAPPGKK